MMAAEDREREKREGQRRTRMLKQYAASMAFVGLLTLVQASSLYVALTWGALACLLAGVAALAAYIAGLADLRRHGVSGGFFTLVRRWVFFGYLAALLITSYL
jgi:hypothetical protein